jgi:hypothetical protein
MDRELIGNRVGGRPSARPVAVDGVGDEYSGAHDAEERGDCFQHGDNPKTQRGNLTAAAATQSKEFRDELNFESWMMILCNRLRQAGTNRTRRVRLELKSVAARRPGSGFEGLQIPTRKSPARCGAFVIGMAICSR